MEKRFDINKDGYSIRCRLICSDHQKTAPFSLHRPAVTHGIRGAAGWQWYHGIS